MTRSFIFTAAAVVNLISASCLIAADEEPKVLHVRADKTGEFETVQAAVNAAPKHAIIRIGPGTFEGAVLIDKPITLEGAGARETILTVQWFSYQEFLVDGKGVTPEDREEFEKLQRVAVDKEHGEGPVSAMIFKKFGPKPTLTVKKTSDVVVKGLSTTMPGTVFEGGFQSGRMILLQDAGVSIQDCALVGSAVDGIEISGRSNVTLQKCLIGGIRASGVVIQVAPRAKIRVTECDIRGCGYAGLTVKGDGEVTISDCRISDTQFHGIRYDDASPTITGNVFSGVSRAGIYVDGKTSGTITDNLFFDCGTAVGNGLVAYNTFVGKKGASQLWKYYTAVASAAVDGGTVRNNVICGYDHAWQLWSKDLESLQSRNGGFTKNLCDTMKSAVIGQIVEERRDRKEPLPDPQVHDLPLPADNWAMKVIFSDPENDDYSLSQKVEWPERELGSRKHAAIKSPWAEQPAEKAMWDRIKAFR